MTTGEILSAAHTGASVKFAVISHQIPRHADCFEQEQISNSVFVNLLKY
jgi:hypothetical protein